MANDDNIPTSCGCDGESSAQERECASQSDSVCCAAPEPSTQRPACPAGLPWVIGQLDTPAGAVPQVCTGLSLSDRVGTLKVRSRIGRFSYSVPPGLYGVGEPSAESPVFVSANYKLSFDHLRAALTGIDGWILVLDTKGINVWCAAGKGTFGTDELAARIEASRLHKVISHRTVIVPQLGAPGVAAHTVRERTGFRVIYGPVRATDIPAFLSADMRATPNMRRVRFGVLDRLVVVPVELTIWLGPALVLMAAFVALSGISRSGYDLSTALSQGCRAVVLLLAAFVTGLVLTPLLLPWLPGRAFSLKGAVLGLPVALGVTWLVLAPAGAGASVWTEAAAWLLLVPACSAFLAMNTTGASSITSLSGVRKEMRIALPLQIACGVIGLALWLVARIL